MEGRLRRLLVICAAVSGSLVLAAPAQADYFVNDTTDIADGLPGNGLCEFEPGNPDTCSLRAAIEESNSTMASDTITFMPGLGTHALASTLPVITQPLVIDGNGPSTMPGNTIIDGTDAFRLFDVSAATTFRDLRLQDGGIVDPMGTGGAAIRTTSADLMLDNVAVTSNQITGMGDGSGAGILSGLPLGQTVTITDSAIFGNTISSGGNNAGAGIFSSDTLNVTDSTVSGNTITAGTSASGGGIAASTDLDIQRSTLSGNALDSPSGNNGGGIHGIANVGTKTITNSTISGNTAGTGANGDGGGAKVDGIATITNTTFANNGAILGGDDLDVGAATATVQNTIFGSGGSACEGAVMSATPGHNIDDGMSCMLGTTNGNIEDTDPALEPLALNAPGTTETHALMAGSPAIGAGAAVGPATDQRGIPRPQGTFCDIGAFELEAASDAPSCAGFPAIAPPVVTPTPVAPATPAAPKKKCKKGRKLKKGKCVKKKRKKK